MGMESTASVFFGSIITTEDGDIMFDENMDFCIKNDDGDYGVGEKNKEAIAAVKPKWQNFWDEAKRVGFKLFIASDNGYLNIFAIIYGGTLQMSEEPIDIQEHINKIAREEKIGLHADKVFLERLLERHGIAASRCSWWVVSDYS